MLRIVQAVKKNVNTLTKLLPLLSFVIPFLALYSLYPESFEVTWKGRTFYAFFLWLAFLELVMSWEKIQTKKSGSTRNVAFIIALTLPTMYVVASNCWGLNEIIVNSAKQNSVPWSDWMPLSTEYLIFAVFFALIILLAYGIDGLMDFSTSVFFLGTIGVIYTIDNIYPYGRFTPFQVLVPTTAKLAAGVLNLMGYRTFLLDMRDGLPTLIALDSQGRYSQQFSIAWPCSGVESLLIYTVIILLFLKKTDIPRKHRVTYFTIGAVVTYLINVLRIVAILVISINGGDWLRFHEFYGQLYSITWIISYPLIIIGSQALWRRIRHV